MQFLFHCSKIVEQKSSHLLKENLTKDLIYLCKNNKLKPIFLVCVCSTYWNRQEYNKI